MGELRLTLPISVIRETLLSYWFSAPPASLQAASQEVDKLLNELVMRQGGRRQILDNNHKRP